jgi:hypothetical protein
VLSFSGSFVENSFLQIELYWKQKKKLFCNLMVHLYWINKQGYPHSIEVSPFDLLYLFVYRLLGCKSDTNLYCKTLNYLKSSSLLILWFSHALAYSNLWYPYTTSLLHTKSTCRYIYINIRAYSKEKKYIGNTSCLTYAFFCMGEMQLTFTQHFFANMLLPWQHHTW